MPALFALGVPEAVLFIHAGEERLDLLRVRELIAGHDHAPGAGFDSQTHRLSVEAVLAQLVESAGIWFEQEDALVGGRQFSTGAVDDTA